jgi:hypothetical protein
MAKKKKTTSIDDYMSCHMPAEDAARQALNSHPHVSELREGLTKAISGTIRRYLSHKPLLKKPRRRK